MKVFILKEGKEYNQGVATWMTAPWWWSDNARKMIGKTIDVSVTSVLQTTAEKMIFGKWDERAFSRTSVAVPPTRPVVTSTVVPGAVVPSTLVGTKPQS